MHSWKFPNDLPNLWEGQRAPTFIENFSSFLGESAQTPPPPPPPPVGKKNHSMPSCLLLPHSGEESATVHFLEIAIRPIEHCSNEWTNPPACGMSYNVLSHANAYCVGQISHRNVQLTVCTISYYMYLITWSLQQKWKHKKNSTSHHSPWCE